MWLARLSGQFGHQHVRGCSRTGALSGVCTALHAPQYPQAIMTHVLVILHTLEKIVAEDAQITNTTSVITKYAWLIVVPMACSSASSCAPCAEVVRIFPRVPGAPPLATAVPGVPGVREDFEPVDEAAKGSLPALACFSTCVMGCVIGICLRNVADRSDVLIPPIVWR